MHNEMETTFSQAIHTGMKWLLLAGMYLALVGEWTYAQSVDLKAYGQVKCGNNQYEVTLFAKAGGNEPVQIGSSSILMDFDPAVLAFSSYRPTHFHGGETCVESELGAAWYDHGYAFENNTGQVALTLILKPEMGPVSCPVLPSNGWVEVGTLTFDIKDGAGDPRLRFDSSLSPSGIPMTSFNEPLNDDGAEILPPGTLTGLEGKVLDCDNLAVINSFTLAEGRTRHNLPVELKFYVPDEVEVPAYQFSLIPNQQGRYVFNGIPPGEYMVVAKHPFTLQTVKRIELKEGEQLRMDFGLLPAGDANNDNQVTILDFGLFAGAFNATKGEETYLEAVDFNGDDRVSILDFSYIAANFNRRGELPEEGPNPERVAAPFASTSVVTLSLEGPGRHVQVEDTFSVYLHVSTHGQPLDGAQVTLQYPEALLDMVGLTYGPQLPQALSEDQVPGQVLLAAGSLNRSVAEGRFALARITFRVRAEGLALFSLEGENLPAPVISYRGKNVFDTASSMAVALGEGGHPFTLYPNPSRGQVTVSWQAVPEDPVRQLEVYDLQGRLVRKIAVGEKEGLSRKLVLTQSGLFWVRVLSKSGAATRALLIE